MISKFIFIVAVLVGIDQGVKLLFYVFLGNNIVILIPNFLRFEVLFFPSSFSQYLTSFAEILTLLGLCVFGFLLLRIYYKLVRYVSPKYNFLDFWVYLVFAVALCYVLDYLIWGNDFDFIILNPTKTSGIVFDIKFVYIWIIVGLYLVRSVFVLIDAAKIELKRRKSKENKKQIDDEFNQYIKSIFKFEQDGNAGKLDAKTHNPHS